MISERTVKELQALLVTAANGFDDFTAVRQEHEYAAMTLDALATVDDIVAGVEAMMSESPGISRA